MYDIAGIPIPSAVRDEEVEEPTNDNHFMQVKTQHSHAASCSRHYLTEFVVVVLCR
jgi:hypothetical protein